MKKVLSILFALFVLGRADIYAQSDQQALSLQECLQYALDNSANIKKSILDLEEGREYTREVKSQGLPQANASLNYTNNFSLPVNVIPANTFPGQEEDIEAEFGTQHNAVAGAEATQLLFDQSFFTGLKAAQSSEELYHLQLQKSKEDVVLDVATTYYNALIASQQIEIVEANLERINRFIEISTIQYENDLINKVDINRLKVDKTNQEVQLDQLTTAYEQQSNLLKYYIGMPIDTPIQLENTSEVLEDKFLTAAIAPGLNLDGRTELQMLNKQQELQGLEQKSIQAGYYPTLSAFINYNYQAQRQEFTFFETDRPWFGFGAFGVNLSIPIFDGFNKSARLQQSKIRTEKTAVDIQDTRQYLSLEYQNTLSQLFNSQKAMEAQKQNVALAEDVLSMTAVQYQESLAPLTDLLAAETSLRNAQSSYNEAKLNFKIAALELLKSKGEILTLIQQQ